MAQLFECTDPPKLCWRVTHLGTQSRRDPRNGDHLASATVVIDDVFALRRAVEAHIDWHNSTPSCFLSVFSDERHAYNWAAQRYPPVSVDTIDTTNLPEGVSFFNMESLKAALNITYKYSAHEFLFLHRIPAQCIVAHWSPDIQASRSLMSQEAAATGYTTTLESSRQNALASAHDNLIQTLDAAIDSSQQFRNALIVLHGISAQRIATHKSLDIQFSRLSMSQEATGYNEAPESVLQDVFIFENNNMIQSLDEYIESLQQFRNALIEATGALTRTVNNRVIGDAAGGEAKEIKEDQQTREISESHESEQVQDTSTDAHDTIIQSLDTLSKGLRQISNASIEATGALTRFINNRATGDAASEGTKEIK